MNTLRRPILHRGCAVLLIAIMAVPATALPCADAACLFAEADAPVEAAADACCARCARSDTPQQVTPIGDHDHGPCECPPGCPGPCGAGKLPCTVHAAVRTPARTLPTAALREAPPAIDLPLVVADIFHPPRC